MSDDPTKKQGGFNAPNALSAFRLAGSAVLLFVAWGGYERAFLWLLIALILSDWLDGKLAIWLKQTTKFGAVLDSVADAAMYAALALGAYWLMPQVVWRLAPWLIAVAVSHAVSSTVGFVKFRRLPSYHTQSAKLSWLLTAIGVITVFAGGPHWPFLVAMAAVVLVNLEATCVSIVLRQWRPDVPSLLHALRDPTGDAQDEASSS
ncbi:MAG: CDP-alcohol phosphatidyltransferase family protein [Planctomycetales bacterium]